MNRRAFIFILLLHILARPFAMRAAIGQGPKLTNAVAADQKRNTEFYRAEQSFQEKLKVGRERYNAKQTARAKIAAAMTAELQARQQVIVLHPVAPPAAPVNETVIAARPWLAAGVLFPAFLILGIYQVRKNPIYRLPQRRSKLATLIGPKPARTFYKVTALQPVRIWATEVCKSESTVLGKKVSRTKERPGWIELKTGEIRDRLGEVIGIHPEYAPRERRITVAGSDDDVIPFGPWTDNQLPRQFYDFVKLEISGLSNGGAASS